MMEISISNHKTKAVFSAKGAELQQLWYNSHNYMWQGNPQFWGKHSPVLFPIVGALKDDTYSYGGKNYHLSRHGFARDLEFEKEQISDSEVLFTLKHDEKTLAVYPFQFELAIRYQLQDATLICSYEVFNPASNDLLFSVGAHPAFAVPLAENVTYADYQLEFNHDAALTCHHLEENLISNKTTIIALEDRRLNLSHQLFYNDALVFKTLKSDQIVIQAKGDGRGLKFNFEGFPYFGIWAAKNADFVCLEPWCGIADAVTHNQQLELKEGIQRLPSSQRWKRSWSVDCF